MSIMRSTFAFLALSAAVTASPIPMPQAVTSTIAPSGTAPPGCKAIFTGSFGLAVKNISTAASPAKRQVTQISCGPPRIQTMAPVSIVPDGQIQGGMHTMVIMPIAQATEGQAITVTTMAAVTETIDGQIVAPTISAVPASQMSDAQPVYKLTITTLAMSQVSSQPVPLSTKTAPAATSSAASGPTIVACQTNGTLALTLDNGILKDSKGRTGYIASNYQFQFDDPPQAGALLTAGFSVCGNHSLALGGSTTFYQCLSGNFYNLYNTNWAPQCSPVTINAVTLVQCSS